MNAGVIVAGGKGSRFGGYKQTTILNNKPIYQYSLDIFNDSDIIDIVYLVIPKDLFPKITKDISNMCPSKKIVLCESGKTRSDSVYSAIKKIKENIDIVVIHDAVRPLIKSENILNLINACKNSDGAILAHPVSDTLKKVSESIVSFTVDRTNLWLAETPQAFNFKKLKSCYKKIDKNNRNIFTDEASLMENFGCKIKALHNKSENIKITEKEDLGLVGNHLLGYTTTGIGLDFHSLIDGEELIIGGHKVKCNFSSEAHSDGDVLTHAVIDALLGALNLGDIGEHFPNTSEYLNISSIELLKKIIKKIPTNTTIRRIDVSIVLNSPKISSHKKEIKTALAKAMGIKEGVISIKATTTNGLKFLDMSSGWGCEAIITLNHEN
tara:strand:- start:652 stop:1794 length:1143 start_codon:yes stop_codon:yes gene_type:complete